MSGSGAVAGASAKPVRRALVFTPMERSRDVIVEAAVLADRLGYEAVVVPEGWGFDATILLAEIATRTEQVTLVSGILSVWGRTAATMAMTATTLAELSGGRFALGLGASTPQLAERFHGVPFAAPADRLDRTAGEVRTLLDGQRIAAVDGSSGLRLAAATSHRVPLWIAGLGPRAVAVARNRADVWFPALLPRDRVVDVADALLGAGEPRPTVAAGALIGAGTTAAAISASSRQLAAWYLTGMGRLYGDFVAAQGYADEVAAVRAANPRPAPGATVWPDDAEPLAEQLLLDGDPTALAAQLAAWRSVTDLVTVCVAPGDRDDVLEAVAMCAPLG